MKATILGCGPSGGVPQIGGIWGSCNPDEPRNRRLRSSLLVEQAGTRLLIDTSPDLRQQCLNAGIDQIDAILWTHAHADHVNGIDDIRQLNRLMRRTIDAYASPATFERLARGFPHVFAPIGDGAFFYKPTIRAHPIDGPFSIGGISVVPFEQDHGHSPTLGFRFGSIAYSTDVVRLDDAAFEALNGVEIWIVDCFCERPHPTHSHLAQTLEWIDRVNPRLAVLTHMDLRLDYATLASALPSGVVPAYDGLIVEAD